MILSKLSSLLSSPWPSPPLHLRCSDGRQFFRRDRRRVPGRQSSSSSSELSFLSSTSFQRRHGFHGGRLDYVLTSKLKRLVLTPDPSRPGFPRGPSLPWVKKSGVTGEEKKFKGNKKWKEILADQTNKHLEELKLDL